MFIRACPPTVSAASRSGFLPHGLKSRESLILFREYEILKCVYWINFNKFKKVCVQFPDDLLDKAVDICLLIEERVKQKVYILADTSFGSCCVDYIAAKHIDADAVIHFGPSCLSANHEIPTLYVFPKEKLDVQAACDTICYFAKDVQSTIVVLYDVIYEHCTEDFLVNLLPLWPKVRVSRLAVPQQKKDSLMAAPTDIVVTKFGRYYSIPRTENPDSVIYVYLTPDFRRKNFENFVLTCQNMTFYRYSTDKPGYLEKGTLPNAIKSRLYDIHRVKEAKKIGILISTLSTDKYLTAIERIKELCRLWNKWSYILCLGKINPEKIANFPEIDLFVLIGCPETTVTDRKSYNHPIVGMMEVEIALNLNNVWWQTIVNDYREFLPGGSQYKEIDEEEIRKLTGKTDVSLLSNAVIAASGPDRGISEAESNVIASRDPLTVTLSANQMGSTKRTWQGLEPNVGNTPVEKAVEGRLGTPSSGYAHPSSQNLT